MSSLLNHRDKFFFLPFFLLKKCFKLKKKKKIGVTSTFHINLSLELIENLIKRLKVLTKANRTIKLLNLKTQKSKCNLNQMYFSFQTLNLNKLHKSQD